MNSAAALAAFVVWLLAFPMDGFLAAPAGDPYALLFFLGPQALALFLAGFYLPRAWLPRLSLPAAVLAAAATAAFPWLPSQGRLLLVAAGVGSTPVILRVGLLLRHSPSPSRSAGWGLVGGNLLLAGLLVAPLPHGVKALLLAGSIASPALLPLQVGVPAPEALHPASLRHYLPFLLAFHLVSGLFYDRLLPAYMGVSPVAGIELLVYAGAVLCAVYPLRSSVDGALGLGIPLSLLALLLFHEKSGALLHASMFAMQASAGFMDAFVLFLLLAHPQPVRAFGVGVGALCAGIAGGKTLSLVAGGSADTFTALGNAALNVALLSLYFAHRRSSHRRAEEPAPGRALPVARMPGDSCAYHVSPGLRARLSSMEKSVLDRVLEGETFREVALELKISESSVKTYMRRLYDKAEVGGKAALLAKLARPPKGE